MDRVRYFIEDYWKWLLGIVLALLLLGVGVKYMLDKPNREVYEPKSNPVMDKMKGKEVSDKEMYNNSSNKVDDDGYKNNKTLKEINEFHNRMLVDATLKLDGTNKVIIKHFKETDKDKILKDIHKDKGVPYTIKESYDVLEDLNSKKLCGKSNFRECLNDKIKESVTSSKGLKKDVSNKEEVKELINNAYKQRLELEHLLKVQFHNPIKNEKRALDTTQVITYKYSLNNMELELLGLYEKELNGDKIDNKKKNKLEQNITIVGNKIDKSFKEILSINK